MQSKSVKNPLEDLGYMEYREIFSPNDIELIGLVEGWIYIERIGNDLIYQSYALHNGGPQVRLNGTILDFYDFLINEQLNYCFYILEALSVSALMYEDRIKRETSSIGRAEDS